MNENITLTPPRPLTRTEPGNRAYVEEGNQYSASLRMSQLQAAANNAALYPSPTMEDIGADVGPINEIVAAKDSLLMRCKETIQELHSEIDNEKYGLTFIKS